MTKPSGVQTVPPLKKGKVMNKLTLDEAWAMCLEMWAWIAEQKKAHKYANVENLKKKWMKKHGLIGKVRANCFFCQYDVTHRLLDIYRDCNCPAQKIDRTFHCQEYLPDHHWRKHPITFYNKIVALNKIRLARKKK